MLWNLSESLLISKLTQRLQSPSTSIVRLEQRQLEFRLLHMIPALLLACAQRTALDNHSILFRHQLALVIKHRLRTAGRRSISSAVISAHTAAARLDDLLRHFGGVLNTHDVLERRKERKVNIVLNSQPLQALVLPRDGVDELPTDLQLYHLLVEHRTIQETATNHTIHERAAEWNARNVAIDVGDDAALEIE